MSAEYDAIMVIIDAYTKMAHFKPVTLKGPIKEKQVNTVDAAKIIRRHIFRQHGIPKSIVSDRDTRFLNTFWKKLCQRLNIEQSPTTAYRPNVNKQTERVNQPLEAYLRAYINWEQNDWFK